MLKNEAQNSGVQSDLNRLGSLKGARFDITIRDYKRESDDGRENKTQTKQKTQREEIWEQCCKCCKKVLLKNKVHIRIVEHMHANQELCCGSGLISQKPTWCQQTPTSDIRLHRGLTAHCSLFCVFLGFPH